MSSQPTNFGGMAESPKKTARAYASVKTTHDVKQSGDYEENQGGIEKPSEFRLTLHEIPPTLPIM
jgi:hypothetical protein